MPGRDAHTLLCERCGYVLEGLPTDSECPECGKPIAESMPHRRTGTPWQQKPCWPSFLRTRAAVLYRPWRTLGVMSFENSNAHLLFDRIMLTMLLSVLLIAAAVAILPSEVPATESLAIGAFIALVLAVAVTLMTHIEIVGLRFFGSRRGFRIDKTIASTICYHGAHAWIIMAIGLSLWAHAFITHRAYNSGANSLPPPPWPETIRTIASGISWLGLAIAAVGFVYFEFFAWLGLRRCKFANRPSEPDAAPKTDSTR